MRNRINNIVKITVFLIISFGLYFIFKYFENYFNEIQRMSIIIIYFIFIYSLYTEKKEVMFALYLVLLFLILFVRDKVYVNINKENYIGKWIKIIFLNKTVFINIVGNLVLYIPFNLYLLSFKRNKKTIIKKNVLLLVIIILLEYIQYISSRGVFDIVDIVINFIGVIISSIIYLVLEGANDERRKQKE